MSRQLALIPRGRHDPGPIERATADTLRSWAARGHLAGPENAASRATLRQLGRLADEATAAALRGERSEYSAAAVLRTFRETLDGYAPPPPVTADPHDETLTAAALAVLDRYDSDDDDDDGPAGA